MPIQCIGTVLVGADLSTMPGNGCLGRRRTTKKRRMKMPEMKASYGNLPTNEGPEPRVLPNIVPQSYTPRPEQFQKPVSQELRNEQAKLAQGFAIERLNELEIQLHLGPHKRWPRWKATKFDGEGKESFDAFRQVRLDAELNQAIKDAKTRSED